MTEDYLPAAFEEAKELIDAAAERKGFRKGEPERLKYQ